MLTRLQATGIINKSKDRKKVPKLVQRNRQSFARVKQKYRTSPGFRAFVLYFGFALFIFMGAGMFFTIEHMASVPYALDPRMLGSDLTCIGRYSYWGAVLYAISAASTIAFGQLHVCTHVSRVITLVYSAVGIPYIVMILADLGGRICFILVHLQGYTIKLIRFVRKKVADRLEEMRKKDLSASSDDIRFIDASDITTITESFRARQRPKPVKKRRKCSPGDVQNCSTSEMVKRPKELVKQLTAQSEDDSASCGPSLMDVPSLMLDSTLSEVIHPEPPNPNTLLSSPKCRDDYAPPEIPRNSRRKSTNPNEMVNLDKYVTIDVETFDLPQDEPTFVSAMKPINGSTNQKATKSELQKKPSVSIAGEVMIIIEGQPYSSDNCIIEKLTDENVKNCVDIGNEMRKEDISPSRNRDREDENGSSDEKDEDDDEFEDEEGDEGNKEEEYEKEVVDFKEFTPDLPLSVCALLIFFLVVVITVHIHEFEYVEYGYSLYYAMLFFILQDYTVRELANVIPTFSLLIAGLAIISTTINAVIYNIQNTSNRIQAKLPEAIRKRKAELAAAGFPDAVVDPNEILKELLDKEGSFLTRQAMPQSTMDKLETAVETTVVQVEQQMEDEARNLDPVIEMRPVLPTASVAVQVSAAHKPKGMNTDTIELIDQLTQYLIDTADSEMITDEKVIHDRETQIDDLRHFTTQATQWIGDLRDAGSNTTMIEKLDVIIQAVTDMITTGMETIPKTFEEISIDATVKCCDVTVDAVVSTNDVSCLAKPETGVQQCECNPIDIKNAFIKPVKATPAVAKLDIGRVRESHLTQGTLSKWQSRTEHRDAPFDKSTRVIPKAHRIDTTLPGGSTATSPTSSTNGGSTPNISRQSTPPA